MLHAYRHPIRVFDLDDLVMLVGPDTASRLLEIGVAESDGLDVIVHPMPACDKFLETCCLVRSRNPRPRDQLTERFENYEPAPGDERPLAPGRESPLTTVRISLGSWVVRP